MALKIEYKKPTGRTASGRKKVSVSKMGKKMAEAKRRQYLMKHRTVNRARKSK